MKRLLEIITIISLGITLSWITQSCSLKQRDSANEKIHQDTITKILTLWKEDSLGCLRLRDHFRIETVINQLELFNKDSAILISYLGPPNQKLIQRDTLTVFYYFLNCSRVFRNEAGQEISDFNLECHFSHAQLVSAYSIVWD